MAAAPSSSAPNIDIDAALAHLAACADPVMATLARRYRPQPPQPNRGPFHLLVSAIIAQQISGRAADAIMARLLTLALPEGGELTPTALLRFSPEELRTAGLTRQKAAYVRALAEACAAGALDLEALALMDDTEAFAALTALKGIGPWTAEMFLLFGLGRGDVLSTGDLGIRAAVRRLYGLPELPTAAYLRELAEPWRPHRSVAMLLLWMSHDGPAAAEAIAEVAVQSEAQPRNRLAPYQPENLFW